MTMNSDDKIAVVGAGPVGLILAAHLVESGRKVSLIDERRPVMEPIAREGISIEGFKRIKARVEKACSSVEEAVASGEHFHLIFVCVKTTDIGAVMGSLPLLLRSDGAAVRFRNGLDTEAPLLEFLGPERSLRGVINYAGNSIGPGRIRMTFFSPPNYIGAAMPGNGAAEAKAVELVDMMNGAGLTSEFSPNIRTEAWANAIRYSAMLPLCALTGMDVAQAMASPRSLHIVKKMLSESIAVAAKVGLHFDRQFFYDTLTYYLKAGHHMPSMRADIAESRLTEVEALNHKIAEYGEMHGIDVSYNRLMANLILCIDELTELKNK